ncbi:MBL fold metallo-hydrolase, partial [Proteus mirabilis]|uniref:MBL fold metallo-hydrolase n=3 Tax=Morganellaceae TaxID=1903414 RepID=UPI0033158673
MISRIFFPIGQGAFYAERHNNFNIVYDCGNWKQTKLSRKIVSQSFNKNESIKILFISHLDWDHISLLETLKNTVSSIDYVILPLLHDEQKILLSNIHRTLGYSSYSIINSPQDFFGDKVKIVYVESSENDGDNDRVIDLDDNDNLDRKIASGTKITINNNSYNWCFIPFNVENTARNELLEIELGKAGFDVEKLKKEPKYTKSNILTKDEKNKLKKVYESLEGGINENSLVIYSGPNIECEICHGLRHSKHFKHFKNFRYIYNYREYIGLDFLGTIDKIGCIYT